MLSKSLKAISRQKLERSELFDRLNSLRLESDQSIALVGATILEDSIKEALYRDMRSMSADEKARLFSNNGPIATFSSAIKIAYANEIIGVSAKKDLDLIREIRNQFAHAIVSISFATPEIEVACANLTAPEKASVSKDWSRKNSRDRFLLTVWHLWPKLSVWASLRKNEKLSYNLFGGLKTRREEIE